MKAKELKMKWHAGEGKAAVIIYREDGYPVGDAKTYHGRIETEEAERNARLMAAAPELRGWLEKGIQLAAQQFKGGDDAPMQSAWKWFAENASAALQATEAETV
jgi:hypothetical protein